MKKFTALEKFKIIDFILKGELTTAQAESQFGIAARTIRNWKKQFLTTSLKGLERQGRADKGKHRSMAPELAELVQALALQKPPLPIATIWRKLIPFAQENSLRVPAYSTLYTIIKKINPALLTLAHYGSKAYRQQYELIYRRECKQPNQVWQADHTQLDICLLDGKANQRRPWLTIILDDFSRAICGYYLSFDSPSALQTALALRQAIWRKANPTWPMCGIPQTLYTDHGSDFMSLHIEQVLINLKVPMINSQIGRPQGRGKIERFFQTINESFLQPLPGYTIGGKPTSKPALDLSAFGNLLERYLLEDYHHSLHATTGETPFNRWTKNGFLPRLAQSLEELDLLLLSIEKPRKVQRDGIRFHGLRYIAPTLAGFVGECVSIRYDPRDLAEVSVYYQDSFLCKAVCGDIAGLQVSLKEIQQARKEVRKGLYQQIHQAKQVLRILHKKQSPKRKTAHVQDKEPNASPLSAKPLKRYEND